MAKIHYTSFPVTKFRKKSAT